MDTVHDLGGKQGFGPIDVVAGDTPFQQDWEERMWALARAGILTDITIDWFRLGLERMVPADYLEFAYFNKWCTNYLALLIDNGVISFEEACSGQLSQAAGTPAAPRSLDDVLSANRGSNLKYLSESTETAKFSAGDAVRTRRRISSNHTRLPAYAGSADGMVIACHGPHFLPDRGAEGVHSGEHLYTVEFKASDLWEEANPKDRVCLELWESYFVRA